MRPASATFARSRAIPNAPFSRAASSGHSCRSTTLLSRILANLALDDSHCASPAGLANLSSRNCTVAPLGPPSSRAMPARRHMAFTRTTRSSHSTSFGGLPKRSCSSAAKPSSSVFVSSDDSRR